MRTHIRFALAGVLVGVSGGSALASENGTQHYPIGVNTVADGNLPPPGMLQLLDYFQVNTNPVTTNGAGDKALPKFDLAAEANAFRFLYTWKPQIGPFHYTTGFVLPVVHLDLQVPGERNHDFDAGDVDIQNYLGYVNKGHNLFVFGGLDTYLPTGHYRQKNLINVGSNYYTFAPNLDITYVPVRRVELTGVVFSEFNTTNNSDGYHSGDDVDVDFGSTFRISRDGNFGVGVQGYFYKQVSDDSINGTTVAPDGHRGQEFAIGPQIRYDIPFGGFVLKYQHEFDVKNRPRGEKIWLEFAVPIAGKPKE